MDRRIVANYPLSANTREGDMRKPEIAVRAWGPVRGFLASAVVFFAALLAAPASAEEGSSSGQKRVGVISILGDQFYDDRVGLTVFGNKLQRHDVTDWGLDDFWESKIEAALADLSPDEIVPLAADRALLRVAYPSAEDEDGWLAQYRAPKFKRITEALQTIARDNQLDAIIVLASDAIDLAGTNQYLESFGAYRSGKKGPAWFYMVSQLHLIDGASGKPTTSKWLETAKREKTQFGRWPSERVPDELLDRRFDEYSGEEKAALAERFKAMPDAAFAPTLSKLLTPK